MRKPSLAVVLAVASLGQFASAAAVKTELVHTSTGYTLQREGKPYFIQGVGGSGDRALLKQMGGNSFRTWGAEELDYELPAAEKLGLTAVGGLWLKHEDKHFSYSNPEQVRAQFDAAKAYVEKFKDSPALLVWGVGNEMEGYKNGDDPHIWAAVEDIAKMIHTIDPNHPTMTVTAEIGGGRVASVNKYCPDIDIYGINSYGGGASVGERYIAAGGTKPFIITEFGPAGAWEVGHNGWGAPIELTSTAKAHAYRSTYQSTVEAERGKLCLGSYAFLWGHKQEATATWFGMFTPDGQRLEAIDTLSQLWTGKYPDVRCPQIQPLHLSSEKGVGGTVIHAELSVDENGTQPSSVDWSLHGDPGVYITEGVAQAKPTEYPQNIKNADLHGADITLPTAKGGYWLYAEVHGPNNTAAIADAPIYADAAADEAKGSPTKLPFVVYGPSAPSNDFVPSGYMGETAAISLDPNCTDQPHDGPNCLKCVFAKDTGWGGVVWQSPANNWGDQPGGFDLTGAKKLTFWARGEAGGEKVDFKIGLIGHDKPNHDSDAASLEGTKLTKEWKQYSIDLDGKDLSHVMTGFVWTLASQGPSVTFYLSNVRYE